MSFDLDALRDAVAAQGRVVRVVIAAIRGSSPREVGAAMLVWEGGQLGTIGGGALEFAAARAARALTQDRVTQHPLGPALGQCCGGAVTLLSEVYDAARLAATDADIGVIARAVGGADQMPLAVARLLARARDRGQQPEAQLIDGWMIEPVHRPAREIWVWGAGHVGRAIVGVLAPLPDIALTWVDTAPERFPEQVPAGVTVLPAARPEVLVPRAPKNAEHLILTYSHKLDLDLCHALLCQGFAFAGLIGSATKWARFRGRLADLGHGANRIARITCPIGDPALGKHPQAIALGVGAALLRPGRVEATELKEGLA
ncbi:xanthine dehydrogenase accessory protein XdhC [Arenibacterium halophilum]|uniref:Xanthine dehydrogenase accessory protein XdhC n=1 Tax=Arenibacterium halophilum TaxID=2583821 RepID=A0ABY2X7S9_9RHOB|nr:xanthine dehydrogenase accessory protein XdhC [Arenibacterium halophilum]TMV11854.1 xanthine dehydrogenase accessory protein XdhC [Arenibacterium halophilum]